MNNSPLGQYAPLVAAVTALGIIGAYVLGLLAGAVLNIPDTNVRDLQPLALVAVGVVFGTATSVSTWKQPVEDIHARVTKLEQGQSGPQ